MAGPNFPDRTIKFTQPISFEKGFWPSTGLVGRTRVPDSARDGNNVLFIGPGLIKSSKGQAASPGSITGGARLYLVDDAVGTVRGKGSVIPYRSQSYWYVADGDVYVGATKISGATAVPGRARYSYQSRIYNVGMAAPNAPGLTVTGSGKLNGSVAVKYSKKRSWTGSESNASPSSVVVAAKGQKVQLTVDAVPAATDPDTYDKIVIYCTYTNQGTVGPFFKHSEITVTQGTTPTIPAIDWNNADLLANQPYITNDPPPQGSDGPQFIAAIGGVVMLIGTYGGTGISPSSPSNSEAYPALLTTFLNPLEQVIGFAARPTEGELILWTKNSLQALVLTGSSIQPILPRALWPTTGIQSPHGGCFADSKFFGYTAKAGPVTLGSGTDPDTTFAQPVREYMRKNNWNAATVVVGYDPIYDAVVYISGSTALAYMRSLGIWSTPITLAGATGAVATVTFEGQLHISMGNVPYGWETGTSPTNAWYVTPAWQDAPGPMDLKTITGFRANGNANPMNVDLFTDFGFLPPVIGSGYGGCQINDTVSSADRYTPWQRVNQKCKTYTLHMSGVNADENIYEAEVRMLWTEGRRV